MRIDTKIIAVKARFDSVQRLCEKTGIPLSDVFWDDRGFRGGGDCWYNAKKAWLAPLKNGCTHRMVLQDDALACDHFLDICEKIVETFPDAFITMSANTWITPDMKTKPSPYVRIIGCKTGGLGLIIPEKHIRSMIEWSDWLLGENFIHDDSRIGYYAYANGIPMITTVPGLLEHDVKQITTIRGHTNKKRLCKTWQGESFPEQDWSDADYSESPFLMNELWIWDDEAKKRRILDYVKTCGERWNQC